MIGFVIASPIINCIITFYSLWTMDNFSWGSTQRSAKPSLTEESVEKTEENLTIMVYDTNSVFLPALPPKIENEPLQNEYADSPTDSSSNTHTSSYSISASTSESESSSESKSSSLSKSSDPEYIRDGPEESSSESESSNESSVEYLHRNQPKVYESE
jgi:hypothetical protein